MKHFHFVPVLFLFLSVISFTSCDEDGELVVPSVQLVSEADFTRLVDGKAWKYIESHEIKGDGTMMKSDYWSGLIGGAPEQYSFSGGEITTYMYIDSYPMKCYRTIKYTFAEGKNQVMSGANDVFTVVSVSADRLCIIKHQATKADGEDIDAIKQYNIYSNGELLGSTEDMSYVDKNIADGEYTYEVEAEYADGRISDKVGTTVSIAADKNALPAISDVEVAGTDGTVNFKWNAPMDDDANNISYCSDTYAQTVAGSESSNYGYVARAIYSDDKLKGLGGYNITQLRFYPVNDAIFTFTLRENGNEVAYVEINDYKLGQWNTVTLEQPVTLKENAEYTLDLDCFDGIPEMGPLGCDNLPVMSGYSNLYSVDGGVSFSQVSGSTIGNWMIGMVAVAPDAEPLPVDGYNVRIDGTAVNASPVAETAYTYDFGADADPDAQHRVAIDAIYTGIGEVRGNTVFFTLGDIPATGIGNVITADLRVYPNPAVDYVAVEGADVESITAYTSEGVLAGTCNGNRLDVSSYAPGMYILKIKADGGVKTVRLMVKR